jgi:hypothetical protein
VKNCFGEYFTNDNTVNRESLYALAVSGVYPYLQDE